MATEQTPNEKPKGKRGRKPGTPNKPKTKEKPKAKAKKEVKRGRKPGTTNKPKTVVKVKPQLKTGISIELAKEFLQLKELLSKANYLANSIKYKMDLGE